MKRKTFNNYKCLYFDYVRNDHAVIYIRAENKQHAEKVCTNMMGNCYKVVQQNG